jgi:hypothetical protein
MALLDFKKQKIFEIQSIINESKQIQESCTGMKYIKNRGIYLKNIPTDLYLHGSLSYPGSDPVQFFPAIVGKITDMNNNILGIQQIFITNDGQKAPAEATKMMKSIGKGATRGGTIKLFPCDGDEIAIAEGIETSLAVHQGIGLPVWSTINANLMRFAKIPESIKKVSIWADKDISGTGEDAAKELANRLFKDGYEVKVLAPTMEIPDGQKGVDWLDELIARFKDD